MPGLDWPGLLRVGLRELRLPPAQFWAMTPAELMILLGRDSSAAPLSRDGLARLAERFPDVVKEKRDGTG